MNIYVGNLSYEVGDRDLERTFAEFGAIKSVKIVSDMATGRSRGFGFVEFESREDGERAIAELNGKELGGRALVVNEARPKPAKTGGFGGGGGGGRGGRGGGGGDYRGGGGGGRGGDRDGRGGGGDRRGGGGGRY